MNLKDAPESKRFEDRTNYINRNTLTFGGLMGPQNSLTGRPPIRIDQLTPQERQLVSYGGLTLGDILLMRATRTTPDQIRHGWNFLPE